MRWRELEGAMQIFAEFTDEIVVKSFEMLILKRARPAFTE